MSTISAAGYVISRERSNNYYRLDTWLKVEGQVHHERQTYVSLAYTELLDVLLCHLEGARPGDARFGDCIQPTLRFD